MVKDGFFEDIALYRSVPDFIVQFGVADTSAAALRQKYLDARVDDDPPAGNKILRGSLSFAGGGKNTRTCQLFIAYTDQPHLGAQPWEVPIGQLATAASFEVLDSFYQGYGDMAPWGSGPDQHELVKQGNKYIRKSFPKIDFIQVRHRLTTARRPARSLQQLARCTPPFFILLVYLIAATEPFPHPTVLQQSCVITGNSDEAREEL